MITYGNKIFLSGIKGEEDLDIGEQEDEEAVWGKPTDDQQVWEAYRWPSRELMFGASLRMTNKDVDVWGNSVQMTSKDIDVCGKPTDDQQVWQWGEVCLGQAYRWPASFGNEVKLVRGKPTDDQQVCQWGEVCLRLAYR